MVDVETELLHDFATRFLYPMEIEKGRKCIDKISRKAYIKMSFFSSLFLTISVFSILLFIVKAVLAFQDLDRYFTMIQRLEIYALVFPIVCGFFRKKLFQTREFLFVKRPYDIDIPTPVEHFLELLSSGKIRTSIPVDTPANINSWRNSEGDMFDSILPKKIFKNRYAPALLSSDEINYSGIWAPKTDLHRRIHVILKTPEYTFNQIDVLSISNTPSTSQHWLCKIPKGSFDELFAVVVNTQSQRLKKKPWTEDKRLKHSIVLKAAHQFSWEMADRHQEFDLQDMIDVCESALVAAKEGGYIQFLGLRDSDRDSKPIEWVRKVIGNSTRHDYAWIKETVDQFTGTISSETVKNNIYINQ